jgi:hypothetical protein
MVCERRPLIAVGSSLLLPVHPAPCLAISKPARGTLPEHARSPKKPPKGNCCLSAGKFPDGRCQSIASEHPESTGTGALRNRHLALQQGLCGAPCAASSRAVDAGTTRFGLSGLRGRSQFAESAAARPPPMVSTARAWNNATRAAGCSRKMPINLGEPDRCIFAATPNGSPRACSSVAIAAAPWSGSTSGQTAASASSSTSSAASPG